jgi:hypothetical protein
LATAVRFADQLRQVDTNGVEPMTTVLEHWCILLIGFSWPCCMQLSKYFQAPVLTRRRSSWKRYKDNIEKCHKIRRRLLCCPSWWV